MRLLFRRRSTKRRFSCSVKELRADVKEMVETVLPCFQNRPSLYNGISKEAQQINETIRALLVAEKPALLTSESTPENDTNDNFDRFLPPTSNSTNSLAELQKDRMILGQLWEIPQRKHVRFILLAIRDQIHADLETYGAIQKVKTTKNLKRLSEDRALLSFVLDNIKDRPHIHLQITHELVTSDHQEDEETHSKSLYFLPQRKRLGSGTESLSSNVSIGSDSTSTHALSVVDDDDDDKTIELCVSTTSNDRWEDVSRLDELIDMVPDTSLALYALLRTLKETYREDAKALQREESPNNLMMSSKLKAFQAKEAKSKSSILSERSALTEGSPLLNRPACFADEIWV